MESDVVADPLTAWDAAVAAAVFVGGVLAGRAVHALVVRLVRRGDSARGAAETVGRLAAVAVTLAALVYALIALGVRLGPFLGALGIGGVAVALAAQTILANLLASVILQVRRPFRPGEQIATNGHEGTVEEVNFRTVVLRTFDGERVYVPSARVVNDPIVNHTRLGRRRTTLDVALAYGTDLARALEVLAGAAASAPGVLADPPAEALVESFADSGVTVAVRFWHAPDIATLWQVRSAVAVSCKQALDAAGIEIPFPQLVLHQARDRIDH